MNRRLRIRETNHGRDGGWFVEAEGRRVALLADFQWADLFWDSYRLDPLSTDPAELAELCSDGFWDRCDRLAFRSREFGEVAPHAFPCGGAGERVRRTGRVLMRGLYLGAAPRPWDWLTLWWGRVRKKAHP